jgi:hypothetical protein
MQSFIDFKDLFSDRKTEPRLVIMEFLRHRFPGHHVTCTRQSDNDFLGYAQSGKADLRPEFSDGNTDQYEAVRKYAAPDRRLDGGSGELSDDVKFGGYKLTWRRREFLLFKASWINSCWGTDVEYWYVLAPKFPGTTSNGNNSLTDELLLEIGKWSYELHNEIYVFDDSGWEKSKELWQSVQDTFWDDVILDPKLKQNLIGDVQSFFENKDCYKKYNMPWKRGIILHGVPGNGKTLSIKALINYLSKLPNPIPALYVKSMSNKCDMPQWSVDAIFSKARKMAPCLLILEDLDSMIVEKVRSYFLNEVDGLKPNDGILMIGSTNHLSRLDPAISKRPSRFDRKYHFRIPDHPLRVAYCEYWLKKLSDNEGFDFPEDMCAVIADLTEGFSYAYMKELIMAALLTVARGMDDAVETGWDVVSESNSPAEPAEGGSEEQANARERIADDRKDEKKEVEKKEKKRETNVVQIPEHLKDNVFLRIVQQQVKILLHEMDNTEEEERALPVLSGDGSLDRSPTCKNCN